MYALLNSDDFLRVMTIISWQIMISLNHEEWNRSYSWSTYCSVGFCRRVKQSRLGDWDAGTNKNLAFLLDFKIMFYPCKFDDILMESDSSLTSLGTFLCPPLTHHVGEVRAFVPLTDFVCNCRAWGRTSFALLNTIWNPCRKQWATYCFSQIFSSYTTPSIINQHHLQSSIVWNK